MTWFQTALIATLCWGTADLFYKCGADEEDPVSHLRTGAAVGFLFGLHALFTLLTADIGFDPRNLLRYLPVSSMYILSMLTGYFGLRYLQLSVSSPIQNCSGALAAILGMLFLGETPGSAAAWIGILLCCTGVFFLGWFESREEKAQNSTLPHTPKKRLGALAVCIPLLYCLIDTLGTFLDDPCLDIQTTWLVQVTEETLEDVGNTAYELTFFLVGLLMALYILVDAKRRGVSPFAPPKPTAARLAAACCETAGQLAYVHVIGGSAVVAAPMIGSYCMVSVLLSRVFLRERLRAGKAVSVAITLIGILFLGIADGLTGEW